MKKLITLILIIVIGGIFIYFNPKKEDFNKYLYNEKYNNKVSFQELELLGLDKILELGYERNDFMLFSVYNTNKEIDKTEDHTYIGILKFFIKIK